jgi:hypothetical protein
VQTKRLPLITIIFLAFLKKFLEKVNAMGHLDKPDYKTLNKMMLDAMKEAGTKDGAPLVFTMTKTSPRGAASKARTSKRASQETEDEVEETVPARKRGRPAESKHLFRVDFVKHGNFVFE